MPHKLLPTLKIITLSLLLSIGATYLFAWTGPTATAPAGNVAAPLNTALSSQDKLGKLRINTDLVNPFAIGLEVFGKIRIADGTQGVGKVLVSDADGVGSWGTSTGALPSGAGYSFGGVYMRNTNIDRSFRSCRYQNPLTGTCSCPTGYTAYQFWEWNIPNGSWYDDVKNGVKTNVGMVDMYQCIGSSGGGSGPGGNSSSFGMNMQVFDTSATWTAPAGVSKVMVEAWGGGGGEGFRKLCGTTICTVSSIGGGGGGYGKGIYTVSPTSTYNVTVGAGGSGCNTSVIGGNGYCYQGVTDGGTSSFGSLISATGGKGAFNGTSASVETNSLNETSGGTSNAPLSINGSKGLLDIADSTSYSAPALTTNGSIGGQAGNGGVSGLVPGGGGGIYYTGSGLQYPYNNKSSAFPAESPQSGAHGRVIVWW